MSDFEDKLNGILSNPDAMAQMANLAHSLTLGGGGGGAQPEEPANASPALPSGGSGSPAAGLGGLAGLGDLLGQIDPKLISRLLPLVGELTGGGGGGGDDRLQLMYALRPFLKPEKRDKVERAVKAARLIHVGKKLLSTMGESDV